MVKGRGFMVVVWLILLLIHQTHLTNGNGNGMCESAAEESRRRELIQQKKRYISYETLRRDMVPCGRAGAPYYNCHVGPVNPYSRGCEVITACRGAIKG